MTHHTDADQDRADFEEIMRNSQRYKTEFLNRVGDSYEFATMESAWQGFQLGIQAARRAPAALVPQGWKLVPEESTEAMARAFRADDAPGYFCMTTLRCADFSERYVAMLAAAPQPPEANPVELHQIKNAAPVHLPDALLTLETDAHYIFNNPPCECPQSVRDVIEWYAASIRELLAAHGIKEQST